MKPTTALALNNIMQMIEDPTYKHIVPAFVSLVHGPGATSAAIRIAKARGLIEVDYVAMSGTPCYRRAV